MEKKYHIVTYGCQMNVHESEKIAGILYKMGYRETKETEEADIIVFNTCCIRENAENHAFGNIGALKKLKKRKPELIIAVGGCMTQEKGKTEILKKKFPFIDVMFGTLNLEELETLIERKLKEKKRVIEIREKEGEIVEGDEPLRTSYPNAWVNIMYGCNNFCSYCIVPYVRGRERSRSSEAILAEVKELAAAGYRDITLLGQNVNSYGRDLEEDIDFADLLKRVNAVPGEFLIRFMTSHPKDAGEKLFDAMASCEKVAPVIHLPFQAGNNRVLEAMNRRYTREAYLEKVRALRSRIPDIVLTSDVIVGFPGETTEEFEDTLKVLEEVRFDALFTFIYSPREGTPAARMPDPMSREEKSANFQRLVDLQNAISLEKHQAYVGKVLRCLVDGEGEDPRNNLTARTAGNRLVHFTGDKALIGAYTDLRITGCSTWALFGEVVE